MSPREIDTLIAEKIMGWKWYRLGDIKILRPTDGWTAKKQPLADGTETPFEDNIAQGKYSTDPAASKQLRDHMRALGWRYRITCNESGSDVVLQKGQHSGGGYFEAHSDTDESAFALAAISAVGTPVSA